MENESYKNRIAAAFDAFEVGKAEPRQTWVEELFTNRQEHTVTGAALGVVRDLFGVPATDEQRAQRAQFNDQCGTLAADVVASVPRLKAGTAGLIRGSMLIDLNGSWESNTLGFTKNVAEGALLNTVVRGTSADSAFGKWTSASLGGGIKGEIGTHLIAGMGFSAVRTGLDGHTWHDGNGNVSLSSGVGNFLLGTASGALVNIPAGMAGLRMAKAATMALSDGIASRIAVGSISGGMSGGVFGFTDSFVQTRSLTDAGRGFLQGFGVGLLAGGATNGMIRGQRETSLRRTETEERAKGLDDDDLGTVVILPRRRTWTGATLGDGKADAARITKEDAEFGDAFRFKERTFELADLTKALGAAKPDKVSLDYIRDHTPKRLDLDDFSLSNTPTDVDALRIRLRNDYIGQTTADAVTYTFDGTKITVPLKDLPLMEKVRQLRAAGDTSPEADIALPEDVVKHLQLIPDRTKIKQVMMLQHIDAEDQLAARLTNPKLLNLLTDGFGDAQARIDSHDGRMSLFQGKASTLGVVLRHEQAHVTQSGKEYESARRLDQMVEASRYGYRDPHESECELEGMAFVGGTVPTFLEATHRAPTRMALIAEKQIETLTNTKPEHRSLDELEILARANYVKRSITPGVIQDLSERVAANVSRDDSLNVLSELVTQPNAKVQQALLKVIDDNNPRQHLEREKAVKLLRAVGDQSAVQPLLEIAAHHPNLALTAIDTATHLYSADAQVQQEFLINLTKNAQLANTARGVFVQRGFLESPSAINVLKESPPESGTDSLSRIRFNLNHGEREIAAHLLGKYGDESDIQRLHPLAVAASNETLALNALDSIILLHSPEPKVQFDYLLEQIAPGSPLRETALRRLATATDEEAPLYPWTSDDRVPAYRSLAVHFLDPSAPVQLGVAQAIATLPDVPSKKYWFDQSMSAIDHMPGFKERKQHFQKLVAQQVLRDVPELRNDATARLRRLGYKPTADDIQEADRAAQAALEADIAAQVATLSRSDATGS